MEQKHALRVHPAAKFKPPATFKGVTTALSKESEAASYNNTDFVVRTGLLPFEIACRTTPAGVHVIWGKINDVGYVRYFVLLVILFFINI